MVKNIVKVDFIGNEDVERRLVEEFDIFLEKLKKSQEKINNEKMTIEHMICDFESIIEECKEKCEKSKSSKEINKYNNIILKIRDRLDIKEV